MSQVFLFSTLSGTIAEAYTFVITVSTLAYLIPYLVSPIFQLKLVATGETYKNEMRARITDGIVAVIALCYALWVIKTGASDIKTFLLGIGLFVIGFAFYPLMNRDQKKITKEKRASCITQFARFFFCKTYIIEQRGEKHVNRIAMEQSLPTTYSKYHYILCTYD